MGALSGLKILDFSTLLPGPYATMMLADMGAEVLKISMRGKTDIALDYPPYLEQDPALSANQAWLNRNKKTMFLNLKKPEAKEIIKKLLSSYDIIMEQNRPGTMDRLGLGYETLREINPRLIYCSLTGYGQTGPMRLRAGHDINYLARSGNMGCAGRRADGPSLTNIQIADVAAKIAALVPEANVAFAHGQMKELELERMMYQFVNGEIDVLVSTTIIETGLDISRRAPAHVQSLRVLVPHCIP